MNQAVFQAHDGPVWRVRFAHPRFESLLASCGYDNKVKIWRKDQHQKWGQLVHEASFLGSIQCLAWGPQEKGLSLTVGCIDGNLKTLTYSKDGTWLQSALKAHAESITGLSWSGGENGRLASCSTDRSVKIWDIVEGKETELGQHADPVRDVAWSPDGQMVASVSEDGNCKVWSVKGKQTTCEDIKFNVPLWKVSWNEGSSLLAISGGDDEVHVLSRGANDEWSEVALPQSE